jgi:hypothetical protein
MLELERESDASATTSTEKGLKQNVRVDIMHATTTKATVVVQIHAVVIPLPFFRVAQHCIRFANLFEFFLFFAFDFVAFVRKAIFFSKKKSY